MGERRSQQSNQAWLASTMRRLLEEKYGPGRVPGVRAISAAIETANGGETISHGHIHNILRGEADNLTDRTRRLLATYFGKKLADFLPPEGGAPAGDGESARPGWQTAGDVPAPSGLSSGATRPDPHTVQALAGRFATLAPEQIAAIQQAIEIVTGISGGRGAG